jgi:hypothetical protein
MELKTIDLDTLDPNISPQAESVLAPRQGLEDSHKLLKSRTITTAIFLVVAMIGFYVGASLKTRFAGQSGSTATGDMKNIQAEVPLSGVKVGDIFGSPDEKAFRDSATGVLDKGGLNGEGTHQIVRPGGVSQTVYVTSSVIDLDILVGNQITAWGETFKGQKVGWLMDVGRVKVENLNMPLPK